MISRRSLFAGVGGLFLGRGVMPDQLVPDSMAATIADMQRRLQVLESTSRVGLNRIRLAWTTHTSNPTWGGAASTWEDGVTAGATWGDDQGNTGTGYPEVTLVTGRKIIVLYQALALDLSIDAGYWAQQFITGVGIDGTTPSTAAPGWSAIRPFMQRYTSHGPATEGTNSTPLLTGRADLTPGQHTIKAWADWILGSGGATRPYVRDSFLAVIPID